MFSQPLEADYQIYSAGHKSRHAIPATVICLAIFNLGLIVDYMFRPELFWLFFFLRSVAATLPCFLLIWLSGRLPVYWLRDWMAAAGLAWIGVGVNVLITLRDAPAAQLAFSIGMLIIVTNIVFNLRTRVAVSTSTLICVVTGAFLWPRLATFEQSDVLALAFLVATSIMTLVANSRLEGTLRHLYLLIMREQMRTDAMERENVALSTISFTDALTGIANRRRFEQEFERICRMAVETGKRLALLIVDVDHFKRYNDTYGHPAGDECLKHVADVLAHQVRHDSDLTCRLGGEEFAVLMQDADEDGAYQVANRVHTALLSGWPEGLAPVTVSIGLAILPGAAPAQIMALADKALYQAKQQGRNQTVLTAQAA
ncbi:GGDEF domain-containing protein [Rhizobium sp. FY34]|uniref:GGDEF domain-containing protein n=1 Tax=Rhizobium sp. FY34 TaxID=2562309 RepID=UPI0014853230|nr:GGDEF domain-containing protein [Rhizobium sp. FY34]